ncbi:MAG TPA: hypothetical protein VFJ58_11035 [Armatimonadota bacterium]|nr:hypothetical protein [Armatimonadota bacterium]
MSNIPIRIAHRAPPSQSELSAGRNRRGFLENGSTGLLRASGAAVYYHFLARDRL